MTNIDAIIVAPWDDGDVCHPADANALRAEVLRLRERDAAWEWLARRTADSMQFKAVGVADDEVGCTEVVALELEKFPPGTPFDDLKWSREKCATTECGMPPDPVALAKALGWKGRE